MNDKELIQNISLKLRDKNVLELIETESGVTVIPLIGKVKKLIRRLTKLSEKLPYFEANTTATQVKQNFRSCGEFPDDSIWINLSSHIASIIQGDLEKLGYGNLLVSPLSFTDLAVQNYPQSKSGEKFGISPHRDQSGFINLVVVLLIQGPSAFFICKDRQGSGAIEINAKPGDLVVMRGGEFGNNLPRPYHFVGRIDDPRGRISFGLRQITSDVDKARKLREVFSGESQEQV